MLKDTKFLKVNFALDEWRELSYNIHDNLWSDLIATEYGILVHSCHDRDTPPQPSHTYSCLLTVQTPPEQSLTKPEPIPGLPNPSTAFSKGCCTDVCLVSIPEAVNTIPEYIWPFLMNPKHLESHQPTPSLHAHPWTWRLSVRNGDWAKPECLAVFLIESYSFSSVLIIIHLSFEMTLRPTTLKP